MFYSIDIDLMKNGEIKIDKKPEDFLSLWNYFFYKIYLKL